MSTATPEVLLEWGEGLEAALEVVESFLPEQAKEGTTLRTDPYPPARSGRSASGARRS